ncbi:MAG TPA: FAD-binding protein [Nitrospirae bacterium]|nr:FAD-binding protein [Nitrospirota bacterium]
MSDNLYDLVIIGGGPAGLSAAQYASRAKLRGVVLDKSRTAGALAFSSRIENYPGIIEPMTGSEMLEIFRKQAINFGAEYKEDVQVVGLNLEGEVKEVFTMGESYKCKTILIATGSMGRKPTIKGEGEFLGRGVSYCAICDANFFKGKEVCVLGDSEEAVKEAILLTKFASTVYLLAPGKALKVGDDYPGLDTENLKIMFGCRVGEIKGTDGVESVDYTDADKNGQTLSLTGVFIYIQGRQPVVDFLMGALDHGENYCIKVNREMETSIPGVFAAGDVICTEVRQVVLAAADGCMAALSAEKHIQGRGRLKSDWAKS